ncbi:MAG TPA: hypothetical protein VGQ83_25445 [Polyangia bacterium]|jgi:hypothetical protein
MRWPDVRVLHPEQWLVIEAVEAHSDAQHRVLDRIVVVEVCADGAHALRRYRDLRQEHPDRELYFVHTRSPELDILERPWMGVRLSDAPHAAR